MPKVDDKKKKKRKVKKRTKSKISKMKKSKPINVSVGPQPNIKPISVSPHLNTGIPNDKNDAQIISKLEKKVGMLERENDHQEDVIKHIAKENVKVKNEIKEEVKRLKKTEERMEQERINSQNYRNRKKEQKQMDENT